MTRMGATETRSTRPGGGERRSARRSGAGGPDDADRRRRARRAGPSDPAQVQDHPVGRRTPYRCRRPTIRAATGVPAARLSRRRRAAVTPSAVKPPSATVKVPRQRCPMPAPVQRGHGRRAVLAAPDGQPQRLRGDPGEEAADQRDHDHARRDRCGPAAAEAGALRTDRRDRLLRSPCGRPTAHPPAPARSRGGISSVVTPGIGSSPGAAAGPGTAAGGSWCFASPFTNLIGQRLTWATAELTARVGG